MSKIAIVTDSNSSITNEKAKELGVFLLPMPITIDGNEYFEDINLTKEDFYDKQKNDAEIFSSQPAPQAVMDLWDEVLKEYDEIVYIPMSSGLSSSYQTARMLAEDYEDKVKVVNNQRISVTTFDSVIDAINLVKAGKTADEILTILEEEKFNQSIYIALDTLHYLKKGGRITATAAALGTLLKIKPVLQIQGDKLDEFAKARTFNSAKTLMINAIKSDIEGRLSDSGKYKVSVNVCFSGYKDVALSFKDEVKEAIKDVCPYIDDIYVSELPLSIGVHIGPGAIAVAASRVIEC